MVKHSYNYKDMTGMKFGRLTIIKDSGKRLDKRVIWECLCDCGQTAYIIAQNLRRGNTKSCGCLSNEIRGKSLRKDISNQRFGRLLVIKCIGSKNGARQWLCQCDCGNIKITSVDNLTSNHVTSCGCYQLERRTGENCHMWKGGISKEPYNLDWNEILKNKIRALYNFTCQLCGRKQDKEKLAIHHIDYDKKNTNINNLISLCRPCHTKTNHNREKWIIPLQYKSGYWQCYE